jgi:hypothetical protein
MFFYGSYKSGLNGTKNYRSVAGFVFIAWIALTALNVILYGLFSPHVSRSVMFSPLAVGMAIRSMSGVSATPRESSQCFWNTSSP